MYLQLWRRWLAYRDRLLEQRERELQRREIKLNLLEVELFKRAEALRDRRNPDEPWTSH